MTSENPALQRPTTNKATQRPNSGKSGNPPRGTGKGGGNHGKSNQPPPSPWLGHPLDPNPEPNSSAGFVEYLRWMRSPDSPTEDGTKKDDTKVQLVTKAEKGDYTARLEVLTQRTRDIAGAENCFEVTCPWRIRVGGQRGPESMLLPAFDNLGIPYIPSSTLRGVARAQALRELRSETEVAKYFGSLEAAQADQAGKIIFLDAYPLPKQKNGGLACDIANNLWSWKEDSDAYPLPNGGLACDIANNLWSWERDSLKYKANPNVFFSLRGVSFLIGLRPRDGVSRDILERVKEWLILGLKQGIGSQVNTGYGVLVESTEFTKSFEHGFFSVNFTVQGQLIHGCQKFTSWKWNDEKKEWEMRGQLEAEVRPTAFKSMLRYWFRVFARGVLSSGEVKSLEGKIFGAIQPQPQHGYLRVRVFNGEVTRPNQKGKNDPCGEEKGMLVLDYSPEVPDPEKETLAKLATNLVWLMFHLGGIGQGARRPCYSRQKREREQPPWWRGSDLIPENEDAFWELPESAEEFKQKFQERLQGFYEALSQLSNHQINPTQLLSVGTVNTNQWEEVADKNCRILVCSGEPEGEKPCGLALLHDRSLKLNSNYDENLCGSTGKPSPVWVSNLGEYQVITIFGVNKDPRLKFLKHLNECKKCKRCSQLSQLFPFKSS